MANKDLDLIAGIEGVEVRVRAEKKLFRDIDSEPLNYSLA